MIQLTKLEQLYAQLWPIVMGIVVAVAATFVHRARSGGVPWGLLLAWTLMIAAGIYMRAGRGRLQSVTFTIVVIALPFAISAFSSEAKLLIVSDWRSYTWLIGHVVLALLASAFGAATRTRPAGDQGEVPSVSANQNLVTAVATSNEGDHVNR